MIYTNKTQARKLTGLSFLGSVSATTKHQKSLKYDELTYTLYLAPAKMSGYEVCPMRSKECTKLCLNESGMNKMTQKVKGDVINKARIKKTKLFFEQRQFFMSWLVDEIKSAKLKADKLGFKFSVRLNNTSDITPESFYMDIDNKKLNVLQIFPKVKFYDYTKVPNRDGLVKKYKNYDLTFSFSGTNFTDCVNMLNNNIRVAVVFKEVPTKFWGRKVIDGDLSDLRYRDARGVIVGLKYKHVRNKLTPDNKFVIQN
jgi:hypothetical protein